MGFLLMEGSIAAGQAFRPVPAPGVFRPTAPRSPSGGASVTPALPFDGHGSDDNGVGAFIAFAVIATIFGGLVGHRLGKCWRRASGRAEPTIPAGPPIDLLLTPQAPDLIRGPDEILDRHVEITRLLESLARTDRAFDPEQLSNWIREFFYQVQHCWQERDPSPVTRHLTSVALARYCSLIRTMRRTQLINRIDDLHLLRLEFVHVDCPQQTGVYEVTALITFVAKAYFVHGQTDACVHDTKESKPFQEFWKFERHENTWRLRDVKQSRDTEPLTAPNRVAGGCLLHPAAADRPQWVPVGHPGYGDGRWPA
jgi:hypothetical protein